jgi:predicted Zn-ribbon and HTH transcriptional regulator
MTSPPPWEVADVIRMVGARFLDSLTRAQRKVLDAIARCRTAALGGHRDQCVRCGYQTITFHSCRNRHCPKCQVNAREKWLQKRRQELLPVGYFHIVFSVPHRLIPLMWQNKKLLFSLLFQATGSTLMEVASDPKRLGAEIGILCILHTWGQTLNRHPHIHCVVPGGGLSPDHTRWISSHPRFFLPVKLLSSVFRDKFVEGLKQAYLAKELRFYGDCQALADSEVFAAFVDELSAQDWVVYAKPPFGGAEHVLQYLARYTHRVAISNHRIVSVDDSHVTFRWKDYAHNNQQRTMTLTCEKFLRRFLQHRLPKGLPRIRYFGWLANRRRGRLLPLCRALLHQEPNPPETPDEPQVAHCPRCHGDMCVIERLTAAQIRRIDYALDTS